MKWETLSSKKIFEHPRITLFEDVAKLPSGKTVKYLHFGKVPDSAMVLAVNNDGKFLLQKEYSYPPNEVLFQLPGGAVNDGETAEEGAARELAEEAGITGDLELLGWFYVHNRRADQKMYVYLATNLSVCSKEKDEEELFEDYWLSESKIDSLIANNEIRNYTALAGWALFKSKKTHNSVAY